MNTELYQQLANADNYCKRATEHLDKANKLEEQATQTADVKKVGFIWAGIGIGVGCMYLCSMIGRVLSGGSDLVAGIFGMIGIAVGAVVGFFAAKYLYANSKKKREDLAKNYSNQSAQERATAEQIVSEGHRYLSLIPDNYWYPQATEYIASVVQSGRANTVPEALAMYDEQLHRWNMEDAQMQILNEVQAQNNPHQMMLNYVRAMDNSKR